MPSQNPTQFMELGQTGTSLKKKKKNLEFLFLHSLPWCKIAFFFYGGVNAHRDVAFFFLVCFY